MAIEERGCMTREDYQRFLECGGFFLVFTGLFILSTWMLTGRAQSETSEIKPMYSLPEGMKGAEYVGEKTCASCHEQQVKEYQLSTHARIKISENTASVEGCEMCHGPASKHIDDSGGKDNILTPRKDPGVCFNCHLDKKMEFRLPYRHPVIEGKMSCADCHSPHGPDVKPWTSTTINDVNEACFKCHSDKRGPFVWEHEVVREGCTTCHKVHGSVNDKMLIARDSNLCLRCHAQANFPTIGKSSHSSRLPTGTCFSGGCHTAVHGSNFDDHLRY